MRRTINLILSCFLMLSFSVFGGAGSVIASKLETGEVQSKPVVTIKTKDGQSYRGTLTSINLEMVQIDMSGKGKTFRLSDVLAISFEAQDSPYVSTLNGPGKLGLTTEELAKTRDVYKALNDLLSKVTSRNSGMSYVPFHKRVKYLDGEVRSVISGVKDNRSKEALMATLQCFVDADAAWTHMMENLKPDAESFAETNEDPVVKAAKKYKTSYKANGSLREAYSMFWGIWGMAGSYLEWAKIELE